MATKITHLGTLSVPGKPQTFPDRTPVGEAAAGTRDDAVRYALMTGAFALTDELTDNVL